MFETLTSVFKSISSFLTTPLFTIPLYVMSLTIPVWVLFALGVFGYLFFTESGRKIAKRIWGDFQSGEEIAKFVKLAIVFFLVIAIYWGMRPLKDGIFTTLVGVDWQPVAKILSPFIITPLVILYSKLVDMFPRNKVFYVLLSIYGFIALTFFIIFKYVSPLNAVAEPSAYNFLGWAWYVYIESFGSLVVALFWAFTTAITQPESAKRGFPLIYLFGQAGNMIGPFVLRAERLGFETSAPIIAILAGLMFLTAIMMWFFVTTTPKSQVQSYEAKGEKSKKDEKSHEEPGFLDGLKLLLKHGYLLGITAIIMFYEIIVTILDFFFKSSAADFFRAKVASGEIPQSMFERSLSGFLGDYAVYTGVVATLCVLFGINNIHRKLGTAASLLLLPTLIAVAVFTLRISPTLMVAFWIMVFSKAVNYALNQPTIKQLYIPTTKDTKYKAQAWIEMFGSRGSKAIGSGINLFRGFLKGSMGQAAGIAFFISLSTGFSLSLVAVWFFVAAYVARTYNKAIKEDTVVC